MTAALLDAAELKRWNHWQHEVRQHAGDWCDARDMHRPLTTEEFARLPTAVARYPSVELCVYGYRGRPVWGFYTRRLPFQKRVLTNVLVVYDPVAAEIVHCMRPKRKKRYCERWGRQTHLFVRVRW
jgi:hypothetical protein